MLPRRCNAETMKETPETSITADIYAAGLFNATRRDKTMLLDRIGISRTSVLFCLAVAVLYLGAFQYYDRLSFTKIWDENIFWETTLLFSKSLIPDLKLLRDY